MFSSSRCLLQYNRLAVRVGRKMSGSGETTGGGMMRFQDSLPHLPVPDLAKSLEKYLSAITPLVGAEQFANTQRIVKEFGRPGGVGEQLQQRLLERANTTENWLADWWLNCAYLGYRLPLVIHSSPASVYPYLPKMQSLDQMLQVTAKAMFAMIPFKEMIDNQTLPVPGAPQMPLCMSQFPKLFSSCRQPALPVDKTTYFKPEDGQHAVVAHNNRFFYVPLYQEGQHLSPSQIYILLKKVIHLSSEMESPSLEECVGVLTAGHRDAWAKHYQELTKDPVNVDSIRIIESALLVVALDKSDKVDSHEENAKERARTSHRVLHGGGTSKNSANRWFDKILQFCVAPDGGLGCYLEHSQMDGVSSILLTNFVLTYLRSNDQPLVEDITCENLPTVHQLEWRLTDSLRSAITDTSHELNTLVGRLNMKCLLFQRCGHAFMKSRGFSSDSFVQLAIQLAHFRLYGYNAPTYESCSTQQFKYARTDTIRSATIESDAFVKAVDKQSLPVSDKAKLMQAALRKHAELAKQASTGQAFDRHLFGLRMIAAERGIPSPEIFADATYAKVNHFRLSTSQVRSEFRLQLSFGPVVEDGFGIAYLIHLEEISFTVATFRDCSTTDCEQFVLALKKTLNDLYEIVATMPTASKI